jgi:hypothetical protein
MKNVVDPGPVQPVKIHQGVTSSAVTQSAPVATETPPVVNASATRTSQDPSVYRYTRSVGPRNIDMSSQRPSQKVQGTSVPVIQRGHTSTSTGSRYDPDYAEIQRIKQATQAISHRDDATAIDRAMYTYHTDGVPGRDDPAVPIPGNDILPDHIPGRAKNWMSKMPNRPNQRQMFLAQPLER